MGIRRSMANGPKEPLLDAQEQDGKGNSLQCPLAAFHPPEHFLRHPGGQEHLKTAAASPCPGMMFLAAHTGCDDKKVSETARIMAVPLPERGPLYTEIHEMVKKVKGEHKEQHYIFVAYCLLITVALLLSLAWFSIAPGILAGACTAFVFELYFLNIFHARHHKGYKLYNIPALDSLTQPFYSFIDRTWGYHPPAWWHNHHVRHHMETNVGEVDPDMPDMYPIVRMLETQEWRWWHAYQSAFWPLMMPFSVARFPVSNLMEHGGSPVWFLIWVALMWIMPVALHGSTGFGCSCLVLGMAGTNITYKFAVSHCNVAQLETQSVKKPGEEVNNWVREQIQESTSWGGYWSCLIFGGINMQIEHHLVPSVDPPLYAFIAPELKKICERHGIRYLHEPSFFHALAQFHRRLWVLGQPQGGK